MATTLAGVEMMEMTLEILEIVGGATRQTYRFFTSIFFFTRHYGLIGWLLCLFDNRSIWRVQVRILQSNSDTDAINFKRAAQDECSIIAVASTILAQIAITALSLDNLSQTPWVARGCFTFSLVSSLIAVYYATKQYCILGRCLNAEDVRAWIRDKSLPNDRNLLPIGLRLINCTITTKRINYDKFPSIASVLTVSAPNILLDSSLHSFVVGLGIYLGFTWTRNLDEVAGAKSNEAVFITYIVGLTVCYGVFALSNVVVADKNYVSEEDLVKDAVVTEVFEGMPERGLPKIDEERAGGDGQHSTVPSVASHEMGLNMAAQSVQRQTQQDSATQSMSIQEELAQVFQEAARLRNESAKVDERLARLLEKLGRGTEG